MNAEETKARVERIRRIAEDDEMAHSEEDSLHRDVLRWIADHSTDLHARELAGIALTTQAIEFSRWCS